MQNQATRRRAPLSRGPERAPQHAVEREIEIRVVHHDHRILAAHLERQALVHLAARGADRRAGFGRPGKRNHRDVRMLDERPPHHRPLTVHELHYFRRQTRPEEDLDQEVCSVGDVLGGLEDHRVSAQQRRKHLPRGDRHRKVERRDDAANPNRTSVAHRPLVAHLARHGVAEQATPLGCGVVRRVDPLLDVAARLGEWLPHLSRHEIGDLVLASRQDVADTPQNVTARGRGRRAPHVEAALRGLHRARDVRLARERESPDDI